MTGHVSGSRADYAIAAFLFFGFFFLYLHSCAPHLAPYRDTGEMAVALNTLGVAHPPGYPLYTLLGRIGALLPVGNPVFRTNVFSAFVAAMALLVFFRVLRRWLAPVPAAIGVTSFGLTPLFWELAAVSEMYTLGVLLFALALYGLLVVSHPALAGLLLGLGLGVRMDLLLVAPVFGWWVVKHWRWHGLWYFLAGGAAGASVFLTMPIRSLQDPVLDWANPETFSALFRSVSRASYGRTLDLVSLSYRTGENFLANMVMYGRNLMVGFGPWGLLLAAGGAGAAWREHRGVGILFTVLFLITCPFYLFLANMPPNPHAMAVVEAGFPVPDLIMAGFVGFGAAWLARQTIMARGVLLTAAAILIVSNGFSAHARACKRHNLFARDYPVNVARSLPRGAIAVFHKDVQLFSLWSAQLLEGLRRDVSLVAYGLAGSPWYWEMKTRWPAARTNRFSPRDPGGWRDGVSTAGERPLAVGFETEPPVTGEDGLHAHGLVRLVSGAPAPWAPHVLEELILHRGPIRSGTAQDFFSNSLLEDYARAFHAEGLRRLQAGDAVGAEHLFLHAAHFDPLFSRPVADRGYVLLTAGRLVEAEDTFARLVTLLHHTLDLADRYKALPEVKRGYVRELADARVSAGAVAEQLGKREEARALYRTALDTFPSAQAHYNLAVTYWGEDWALAAGHMRAALAIDPGFADAERYLPVAEERLRQR